jgi:hypothetical protein
MPHKANAARRHHIPRPKRRVTNWAEYNEALRQRGSLTHIIAHAIDWRRRDKQMRGEEGY